MSRRAKRQSDPGLDSTTTTTTTTTLYRIVVLGDGAVGKSAMTIMFVGSKFVDKYDPTLEDLYQRVIEIDGNYYVLDIMDTAGQEYYKAMRDQQMQRGNGFVVAYAMNQPTSFESVKRIIKEIDKNKEGVQIPIVVSGNKKDIRGNDRTIKKKPTKEWFDSLSRPYTDLVFCSAKLNQNINKIFIELVKMMRNHPALLKEQKELSFGGSGSKRRCNLF